MRPDFSTSPSLPKKTGLLVCIGFIFFTCQIFGNILIFQRLSHPDDFFPVASCKLLKLSASGFCGRHAGQDASYPWGFIQPAESAYRAIGCGNARFNHGASANDIRDCLLPSRNIERPLGLLRSAGCVEQFQEAVKLFPAVATEEY